MRTRHIPPVGSSGGGDGAARRRGIVAPTAAPTTPAQGILDPALRTVRPSVALSGIRAHDHGIVVLLLLVVVVVVVVVPFA